MPFMRSVAGANWREQSNARLPLGSARHSPTLRRFSSRSCRPCAPGSSTKPMRGESASHAGGHGWQQPAGVGELADAPGIPAEHLPDVEAYVLKAPRTCWRSTTRMFSRGVSGDFSQLIRSRPGALSDAASPRSSLAPSPRQALPCMQASVRRLLARQPLEHRARSAARARSSPSAARNASLGPRMSDSVSASSPCRPA